MPLTVFEFEQHEVRLAGTVDKPEWIAVDVAKVLDIKNVRQNLAEFDNDEKGVCTVYTPGGKQELATVTEPGLYRLIFKSRKPVAKRFRRWVTHDVLPSIRKTGSYSVIPQKAKLPDGLLNLVARIEKRGEELHTAHHRLMSDVRELVEVVRTTYNQESRQEFCDLLRLAADQIEKAVAVSRLPEMIEEAFIISSTQTGCLERYTSKRKNKAGEVVVYPKINAVYRDESIDEDWSWRYRFSVKDQDSGKWTAKSRAVKLDKLPAVRAAIALDATLPTILRLIEGEE